MGTYEKIKEFASKKGYSINRLEKELGLPRSSISKYNKNTPGMDKLQKIAAFLEIPVDYLMSETPGVVNGVYYADPESAEIAQEFLDNPELRSLFRIARGSKPENLKLAGELLKMMKETNPDG